MSKPKTNSKTQVRRAKEELPKADEHGMIPTLNDYGYTYPSHLGIRGAFIKDAAASQSWSLDIGCAYGLHTIDAIKGGARVVANDLDKRHLQILRKNLPKELSLNLRTRVGPFQNLSLPANSIGTILASNVLHFMDVPELERSIKKMYRTLKSGGKAYIGVCAHNSIMDAKVREEVYRRKASGEKYPGTIRKNSTPGHPSFFHTFDDETLSRAFRYQGFIVEMAQYRSLPEGPQKTIGNELLAMVVRKP
jgi:SAM-dependent methyltransferase